MRRDSRRHGGVLNGIFPDRRRDRDHVGALRVRLCGSGASARGPGARGPTRGSVPDLGETVGQAERHEASRRRIACGGAPGAGRMVHALHDWRLLLQ